MKKGFYLISLLMFFLLINMVFGVNEKTFNFSKGSTSGIQFVINVSNYQTFTNYSPDLSEITAQNTYSDFQDVKISDMGVWLLKTGAVLNVANIKGGFSNNSNYLFNIGSNPLIADNKTFYIFQRLGALNFGSNDGWGVLDFFLNETYYITNNSTIKLYVPYYDYVICDDMKFNLLLDGQTVFTKTFNMPSIDVYNYTYNITTNSSYFFDRFSIQGSICSVAEANRIYFSAVYMNNTIPSGINNLPEANITFNNGQTICINKTELKKVIPVNISAFDSENDTILYNFEDFNYYSENTSVKYSGKNCLFGGICFNNYVITDVIDKAFYNDPQNNGSYCQLEASPVFIFEFPPTYYSFLQTDDLRTTINPFMLNLDYTTCTINNKQFIYMFDNVINNLYYHTEIYGLTNLDQFNISFYASDFRMLKTFNFLFLENLAVVVLDTRTNSSLYLTGLQTDFNNSLDIQIFNGQITLKQGENIAVLNYSNYQNDSIKFVGLNIYPTTAIRQNGFDYGGVKKNIEFSSSKINNITIYQPGNYNLNFYFTDLYHLNSNYLTKNEVLSVYYCEDLIPPIDTEITDILKTSFSNICHGMDGAGLEGFSFCTLFVFILGFIALLIAVVMAIIVFYIAPGFVFPVFLFVFSLIMILGGFLVDLGATFKIILAILFSISIALFLRNLFVGNNEG